MSAPNRLDALLNPLQTKVTGFDFIYVDQTQTVLNVFFLKPPASVNPSLVNTIDKKQLRIYSLSGGETLAEVPVAGVSWMVKDGLDVMEVTTLEPGDFSRYALHLEDARMDPFFNDIEFTFKANCKSFLDCKRREALPDLDAPVDFPVDYMARDFWSFRRALLDFASQKYPGWQDRLEADAGIMLTEAMSALADDMSYYQDRVAREAYLESATQRRSIRALARLVDYTVYDGLAGRGWVMVTVAANSLGNIPAGTVVWDQTQTIIYEIGHGLAETLASKTYSVDAKRNVFAPHLWDENATVLPVGATTLYLDGAHAADLPFDDFPIGQLPGKWLLLYEKPANPAANIRSKMVRVIAIADEKDPVFNQDITRLDWETEQALLHSLDLTQVSVYGNMLPVTAGATQKQTFTIRQAAHADPSWPLALEREGTNQEVTYRFSLPGSDQKQLTWLGPDSSQTQPEIFLQQKIWSTNAWVDGPIWHWRRSLVGVNSSQSTDEHFILEDGFWKRIAGFRTVGQPDEFVFQDYSQDQGWTIRFGDGEFGKLPAPGMVFEVIYRLGRGTADNVLANGLSAFAVTPAFVAGVTNLEDIVNAEEPEPVNPIQQLAPEEFRSLTYRAVRPEDYAEAAERLPWVQRAGAAFRYTGSWLSAFVTPDPKGTYKLDDPERLNLEAQLDRFRQAGREAYVLDPVYATLDLEITICVEPSAYSADVGAAVLIALLGEPGIPGFFSPDNFTFGTPLRRPLLEKAIQDVPNVRTVLSISFRRRGWFDWRDFTELEYAVGDKVVIRVENDPFFPERGSLKLVTKGGA